MDAIKILGALMGNNATGGNLLGSLMSGALGGGGKAPATGSGSGGLLGDLLGGGRGSSRGTAAGATGGGMLGMLLKSVLAQQLAGGGGAKGLMGAVSSTGIGDSPEAATLPPEANDQATILIRAMCNSAKADGQIDQQEQDNIVKRMGDLDAQEVEFLRKELASPLDVQGFVRSVPQELAPQVYALSVMTVKVDTRQEVAYLNQLAQELGLDRQTVGQIHEQLGIA